jgi:hypothetical protein
MRSGSSPNSPAVPSGRTRAGCEVLAAVSAGEYIDLEAALRERLGQGDGERGLAGAARREIPDADDGIAEAADGLKARAEPEFARGQRKAIKGDEWKQKSAARRWITHAGSFMVAPA